MATTRPALRCNSAAPARRIPEAPARSGRWRTAVSARQELIETITHLASYAGWPDRSHGDPRRPPRARRSEVRNAAAEANVWQGNRQRFALTGSRKSLSVQKPERIARLLKALHAATRPHAMDLPGLRFHQLKGRDGRRYAIWVSENWRLTFSWDGADAIDVDLEDYH